MVLRRKELALKRKSPKKYQVYLQRKRRKQIKKYSVYLGILLVILGVIWGCVAYKKHKAAVEAKAEAIRLEEEAAALEKEKEKNVKDITVGATGCMLLHGPILNSAYYKQDSSTYDFTDIYKYIKPYYSQPDFMTCEFEGSLAGSDYSGYPMFRAPDAFAESFKEAGVDLVMLASNHIYDGLEEGFQRTMDAFENLKLPYTGIRQKASDKRYYIADVKGIKIGYINYVYEHGSDGGHGLNYINIDQPDWERINTFDIKNPEPFYQEMEQELENMKKDGVQFVIANMHWGEEYHLTESDYQDEIAQRLCDMGVDALIGGHPHCEQPIDVLTGKDNQHNMLCVYSVGNALSNQRRNLISEMNDGHTEDGVMVTLKLHQDKECNVTLTGVDLLPTWVYMESDSIGNTYYILPLDDLEKIEGLTGLYGVRSLAQQSYDRTMEVLGPGLEKAKSIFEKNE